MNNAIVLIARLMLAHMFVLAGVGKITGYAGTQGYMESMGVPGALLPLVILLELGGGLALIIGFLTRWVALALAAFCVASAVIFHMNWSDQMQMIMFMKNVALAGGFLLLYVQGAGAYSVDAQRGK
ncbi:DoxX family protein [Pseudomonas taeanensis MS-3]|jgi:putative oxidoreductase|uniref:DoxX family protein n=1 Tax=Pseudomonas taeanensis MS-3 TaxID=1395571 RepID=A0A0A1YNU2_9PSED|nr:DoxX family protein [Pseudomonas taeanensis]KFX70324.1 DoxX family protein [Pseudomonas taeanensis MS-3]